MTPNFSVQRLRPALTRLAAFASFFTMAAAVSLAEPPVATAPATAPAARDWHAFPAIVQLQTDQDLFAIGDLHADYDKAIKLLVAAGLIKPAPASPAAVQWTGGKSVLVCTGDFIDKWTQALMVVELLRALQTSAAQSGGTVIVTLGNHEAEFLAAGGVSNKSAEFATELQAQGLSAAAVAAGKDPRGIGAWLRTRPIGAKVNHTFFCHAGNTFGLTVADLEKSLETGIDKDGFGAFVLSEPNSILEARMSPVPWFARGGATQPAPESPAATLSRYLAALDCQHLVIGHQPGAINFGNTLTRKAGEPFCYEGLLFLIDVGYSRGVQDTHGAVLKIHAGTKEQISVLDDTGQAWVLWVQP